MQSCFRKISGRTPSGQIISVSIGDRLTERALRHLIQKYMKAARLEGLSAHHLRHQFGYLMAENTPLHRLAQIMGHIGFHNIKLMYTLSTTDKLIVVMDGEGHYRYFFKKGNEETIVSIKQWNHNYVIYHVKDNVINIAD